MWASWSCFAACWGSGHDTGRDLIARAESRVRPADVRRLDGRSLLRGVTCLSQVDADLAAIVQRHGPPPLWGRPPGLATLIRIMLEQQVSLASGRAMYLRLKRHVGDVTAASITRCGASGLRQLGLTRQKAGYCVGIAEQIQTGTLDLRRIGRATDAAARQALQRVNGIGPWTADIYLLMALRRPDVWPAGDLALLTALQHLRQFSQRPTTDEAAEYATRWAPWRGVAARILWHGYLAGSLRRIRGQTTV